MNCPRKSRTIPLQITLPSWGLAFLLGVPSPSLAYGWVDITKCRIPVIRQGCRNPASKDGNTGPRQKSLYSRALNYGLACCLTQALTQLTGYRPWPGFRHPCQNDGVSSLAGLVYNDECFGIQSPLPSFFKGG